MYQSNDDVEFVTPGWAPQFASILSPPVPLPAKRDQPSILKQIVLKVAQAKATIWPGLTYMCRKPGWAPQFASILSPPVSLPSEKKSPYLLRERTTFYLFIKKTFILKMA